MHFIPLDSSVGIGTPSTLNTGQILSPSPSTDMREESSSLDNLVDLLPQIPRLRTPVDHSNGAPIVGIDFGIHYSIGNFAMIDTAQHSTLPL